MKDWQIRTLKTFVEAFGGVFVPALCVVLVDIVPKGWNAVLLTLVPTVCSACAAGITAAWNIILEHLKEGESA